MAPAWRDAGAPAGDVKRYHRQCNPDRVMYSLTLAGPSDHYQVMAGARDVLHVEYSFETERPHIGMAPVTWAATLGSIVSAMEQRLKEESNSKVGYLIPIPRSPVAAVTDANGNICLLYTSPSPRD